MASLLSTLAKATTSAVKASFADFNFEKEMENARKSVAIATKRLGEEIKRLNKHVHNYFDKWVVDVKFDQNEDIIKSQVKNGSITITVTKESTNAETVFTTTIPDDVIIESLVQKYDPKEKKALFIFTKKDVVTPKAQENTGA